MTSESRSELNALLRLQGVSAQHRTYLMLSASRHHKAIHRFYCVKTSSSSAIINLTNIIRNTNIISMNFQLGSTEKVNSDGMRLPRVVRYSVRVPIGTESNLNKTIATYYPTTSDSEKFYYRRRLLNFEFECY